MSSNNSNLALLLLKVAGDPEKLDKFVVAIYKVIFFFFAFGLSIGFLIGLFIGRGIE